MTTKLVRQVVVLLVAAALMPTVACKRTWPERARAGPRTLPSRPNILLVIADDMGWKDVGFHGGDIATPHLDRLAADGVELEQFYAQAVCSQTRAALHTGRYPLRYGLQFGAITLQSAYGLDLRERTLAQALHDAGYATFLVGKWHLGHHAAAYLPMARGFDYHYGNYCAQVDQYTHQVAMVHDWHRGQEPAFDEGYSTHLLTREATRIIRANDPKKPMFLELAYTAPHAPLQAPPGSLQRQLDSPDARRRAYRAMVSEMDQGIGEVLKALDAAGMRENTVVIFVSDNGGNPDLGASNAPFRGGKGGEDVYEGGFRVPAVITWPGVLRPGMKVPAVAHAVDLYPTLLHVAGAATAQEQPQERPIDGRDLSAVLTGEPATGEREIPLLIDRRRQVVRSGDYKLVLVRGGPGGRGRGERAARGDGEGPAGARGPQPPGAPGPGRGRGGPGRAGPGGSRAPRVELFNLATDRSEATNLSETLPDKTEELMERAEWWAAQAVDELAPMSQRGPNRRVPDSFVYPPTVGEPVK